MLRYANRTAADVLGWDVESFIGRSVLDLVHPDDTIVAIIALVFLGTTVSGVYEEIINEGFRRVTDLIG